MTILERRYNIADFDTFLSQPENQGRLFELVNGDIIEKMPTEQHGYIAGLIVTAINNFTLPRRIGIAAVEARHRNRGDAYNDRIPDVSFTKERRQLVTQGSVLRYPDLVVEIRSPDDSVQGMRDKAIEYVNNGVSIVWLVHPRLRFVEVYRPNHDVEILGMMDQLSGDDVLPGFTLPISYIFNDPFDEESDADATP
ncbi:MAG: Uma2 family endonuclease [Caldilineaceae bacterium]|nr:Uma2 family endonuclease [Caldilineaceae bacterium]